MALEPNHGSEGLEDSSPNARTELQRCATRREVSYEIRSELGGLSPRTTVCCCFCAESITTTGECAARKLMWAHYQEKHYEELEDLR